MFLNITFHFFLREGREIATIGGPKQVYIISNITNNIDDPIFFIPGEREINWSHLNNGSHAVFVSKDAQRFPICRKKLMLQMNE